MNCPECGASETSPTGTCLVCHTELYHGVVVPSLGMVEEVPFAACQECGGKVVIRIWAEGIDAEAICLVCEEREIYR